MSIIEVPAGITPASEWRKARETQLQLPSGKTILAKRPDPIDLVLQDGVIPDSLAQLIVEQIGGSPNTQWKPTRQEVGKIGHMMNTVAKAVFLYPEIVDGNPGEGQILIEDVSADDKMFLLNWALGVGGATASAARFPKKPPR